MDQDLFWQVLFSTQFQITLMVTGTTISQPHWRRPETHSTTPHSWDYCPVYLSWENKLVGTLPASKDLSYNFKSISFWSSREWDKKGQVDYTLKAFKFLISDMGGHQNTRQGLCLESLLGGTADVLLHWKISHPENFVASHSVGQQNHFRVEQREA